MPEAEETNVSQVGTGAGEIEGQVAADPGVTESQVAVEEKKDVPYDRFKEVNDAKNAALESQKAAEAQNANLQAQFNLIQSQGQPQAQPQTRQSFFKEQFGLEPFEQPTAEQIEAHTAHVAQQYAQYSQQVNATAANQRYMDGKSDFAEKVGVVDLNNNLTPSQAFQSAMAADPSLLRDYMTKALTPQAAYRRVKAHETAQELAAMKSTAKEQENQKQAALKTGPLSSAAAGGGGAMNQTINAGHDGRTPEGKQAILGNFQGMLEGDYDTDDD